MYKLELWRLELDMLTSWPSWAVDLQAYAVQPMCQPYVKENYTQGVYRQLKILKEFFTIRPKYTHIPNSIKMKTAEGRSSVREPLSFEPGYLGVNISATNFVRSWHNSLNYVRVKNVKCMPIRVTLLPYSIGINKHQVINI